ncbi:hypothetical protein D3C85_1754360 [compost metagenome]
MFLGKELDVLLIGDVLDKLKKIQYSVQDIEPMRKSLQNKRSSIHSIKILIEELEQKILDETTK